jgi:hypothetical protein
VFSACTSGDTSICEGLYNISELDNFNLIFNITGGTDYTGYTGQFCYKVFGRNTFTINTTTDDFGNITNLPITTETPLYENCVDFSGITSNTITELITSVVDLPIVDNDYRLVDYVKFVPNECSRKINEESGGYIETNTWDISDNYINFDYDTDWYFVTVVNPPKPLFPNPERELISNGTLYTEKLNLVNGQTTYPLTYPPNGGVANINVNGITLTANYDYFLDFSQTPQGPTIINFNQELEFLKDVVTATYIIGGEDTNLNNQSDLFSIETIVYTGSTTGVTATTVNIVNYNPTSGLQEIFLQSDIMDGSSVVLTINGVEMTENIGFYRSNSVSNKLNLHPNTVLLSGDILTIWYFKQSSILGDGDLGKLTSNDVKIRWNIADEIVPSQFQVPSGYFTVEVTDESDVTYSGVTYSATTPYSGRTSYSETFNGVTVNKKYIYRVCLNKVYTSITGDSIITTNCSDNGSFDLTSGQLLYSD